VSGECIKGDISGFLNVCKPPGMTSYDVVSYMKKLSGMKKIGHGGTLDPAAAGVLPLAFGTSTRFLEYCLSWDKEYIAEITFGVSTWTDDAQGEVISEKTAQWLKERDVTQALDNMVGEQLQMPPRVSALKYRGKRFYRLAAQKEEVPLRYRPVTIYRIQMNRWEPGQKPRAIVAISCSQGTYIRSIARDLGENLKVGAHVSFLVRCRSGIFALEEASTLDEIEESAEKGVLFSERGHFILPERVLSYLPAVRLNSFASRLISNGSHVTRDDVIEWVRPEGQDPDFKDKPFNRTRECDCILESLKATPKGDESGRAGPSRDCISESVKGRSHEGDVRLIAKDGTFLGTGYLDDKGRIIPRKIMPLKSGRRYISDN
jgi:tRNA pseudouridine55 synthase